MTETDRRHYCPTEPYVDAPQSIGNGVTISAPHMVLTIHKQIFYRFRAFIYILLKF